MYCTQLYTHNNTISVLICMCTINKDYYYYRLRFQNYCTSLIKVVIKNYIASIINSWDKMVPKTAL